MKAVMMIALGAIIGIMVRMSNNISKIDRSTEESSGLVLDVAKVAMTNDSLLLHHVNKLNKEVFGLEEPTDVKESQ